MIVTPVPWESVESEGARRFWPTVSSAWDYVFPGEQMCAHSRPEDPDDPAAVLFRDWVWCSCTLAWKQVSEEQLRF